MFRSARFTIVAVISIFAAGTALESLSAEDLKASAAANSAAQAARKTTSLAEGLTLRFNSAVKAFEDGRMIAAELDIRAAATLVEQEAKKATGESHKRLKATADTLTQIAEQIRNSTLTSERKLRESLANVHLSMAVHHTTECRHCLKDTDTRQPAMRSRLAVGLDSGLLHFEEATKLAGRKLNKATRHGLMQSRDTVELIAEGSRDTVADTGRAVSWLTRELKDMVRNGRIGIGNAFEENDLVPSLNR